MPESRLEEIEQKINEHYRFFAQVAPGVRVQESGQLAQWWRYVDLHAGDPVE